MSDADVRGWETIWRNRELPPPTSETLAGLMAADGFDSGFAAMTADAWARAVRDTAARLRLVPSQSVFEVGCGAGAWLFELDRAGHSVGGIDLSPVLVARAREVMPDGAFSVAEAAELEVEPPADAVVSFGVFMYFSSLEHAERVLDLMVAKARHCVALFDCPDAGTRAGDLARRVELAGGPAAYAERYSGLDQQYFDRGWMVRALESRGLVDVHVEQQSIDGYANAPFRFNAWGFKP